MQLIFQPSASSREGKVDHQQYVADLQNLVLLINQARVVGASIPDTILTLPGMWVIVGQDTVAGPTLTLQQGGSPGLGYGYEFDIEQVTFGRLDLYGVTNGVRAHIMTWMRAGGKVGIGTIAPTSSLQVIGLPIYANNAAALAGGLTIGAFYRTGADPDPVCVVH